MVYSKKFIHNECAVSEVLSQVLLTIVIIIVMASISAFVLSESKPSEVPQIDFYEQLDPVNDTIVLFNNGGKPVPIKEFKLVMQSGSTEYFINGEELSSKLTEQCGDNGYWDLGEYISINVAEMCGLDLENRDEDLNIFFIHTPSKQVIQKSFVPSIYLDDVHQNPNYLIPRDWYTGGSIWIPPQLLALDNSVLSQKSEKKPDLIGSACLDDVQKIGGGFTTYYPNEEASMYESFEFGLNESVLKSFGVTFSDYNNLSISGVKIKVIYSGHDKSFKWINLRVWDQTEGKFYEYDLPEHKKEYVDEVFDLPHITTVEDLENLNVSILAKANNGLSDKHDINIDYLAVYIPSSSEISPAQNNPPVANAGGPYSTQVGHSVTFDGSNSNDPDGDTIEYLWNFGDGNTSSGVAPTHIYSAVGNYSVTLTVTDDKNVMDTDVTNVVVTAAPLGNLIHIESVIVTTDKDHSDVTATAVVTILDKNNTPINGAKVSGSWSGAANDTDSAVTGATGKVTVKSDQKEFKGNTLTFTFTVNGVNHTTLWDNITKFGTEVYHDH